MCTPIPEEEKRREERKRNVKRKGGWLFVKSFKVVDVAELRSSVGDLKRVSSHGQ
jgi:hypothetical protein